MLGSGGPSTRAPIGASRVLMDHGLDGAAPPVPQFQDSKSRPTQTMSSARVP